MSKSQKDLRSLPQDVIQDSRALVSTDKLVQMNTNVQLTAMTPLPEASKREQIY